MMRVVFAALLALPSVSIADLIAPEEDACSGKARGQACEAAGRTGQCLDGECCRNDYSNGTPPTSVCEACLTCQDAPADADAGETTPKATEDDGCSASAGAPGPWGWAAAVLGGLLVIGLRRRRG